MRLLRSGRPAHRDDDDDDAETRPPRTLRAAPRGAEAAVSGGRGRASPVARATAGPAERFLPVCARVRAAASGCEPIVRATARTGCIKKPFSPLTIVYCGTVLFADHNGWVRLKPKGGKGGTKHMWGGLFQNEAHRTLIAFCILGSWTSRLPNGNSTQPSPQLCPGLLTRPSWTPKDGQY